MSHLPPKRRIKWVNRIIGLEKALLKQWADGEITAHYAAFALSELHKIDRKENYYTAEEFVENANWLGWFR